MAATAPASGRGNEAAAPRWPTFAQHDGAPTTTTTTRPGEAVLTQGLGALGTHGEELLEAVLLVRLAPADLGRLACASPALQVLCAEEPLWQALALALAAAGAQGGEEPFRYLGSWRATAVHLARQQQQLPDGEERSQKGAGRCRAVPNVPLADVTRVHEEDKCPETLGDWESRFVIGLVKSRETTEDMFTVAVYEPFHANAKGKPLMPLWLYAQTKGGKKLVDTSWEKCLTLPGKLVEAVPLSYAKAIHDASGSREVFNKDGTMVRKKWSTNPSYITRES
eukprot:jgi/Tetstr1/441489/TSEL_029720.t1